MDLLIEKGDKRTYLSRYKVITTSFEESSPSVKRNNTQIQYRNGSVDFGGWNEEKTIDYVGYYRADDLEDEEYLRERIYALLSDPEGYYITQLKNDDDNSFERPGETSGDYFDKQVNRPSHKRFYVYASSLESELVGSYGGHVLYKISAKFTTMKLPYGESVPRDLDFNKNVPYYGRNLLIDSKTQTKDGSWLTKNNYWTDDWGTYLGSNIKYATNAWDNVRYSYKDLLDRGVINTTDDFTYSIYFRVVGEDPAGMSYAYINFLSSATTKNYLVPLKLTSLKEGQWARIVVPFKFMDIEYDSAKDFMYSIRVEVSHAPKVAGARYEFAAPKLEKGTIATAYSYAPEDPGYNEWYINTYYKTDDLVIPYAGTVTCNQLEQGLAIEFTAKEAGSRLVIDVNGTELTYSGQVYSGDVFKLSGYEYIKNGISIVKATNKAYFKLLPGIANKISSNIHGLIRILNYQDLYA